MNERIKQLAEQANPDFKKFYIVGPWHAEDIEKFAQLIVRECARVCSEVEDTYGNLNKIDIAVGAGVCVSEIKEHFGVEE